MVGASEGGPAPAEVGGDVAGGLVEPPPKPGPTRATTTTAIINNKKKTIPAVVCHFLHNSLLFSVFACSSNL